MTVTVQHLLDVALHEVGYVEGGGSDHHSGNITKYWAELAPGNQGQPWCAAYQRWVDKHAGAPLLPIANPFYCPSIVTYARQHKLWIPANKITAGDYVLYNFKKNGVADHIGRATANAAGGSVKTVEGNTSKGAGSVESQRNGGGVYTRNRSLSLVLGGLDYSRFLALTAAANKTPAGLPPRNNVKANPFAKYAAPCKVKAVGNQVKFVQWAVGVPVDGTFGNQTAYAVKEFQKYHHLTVDGVVGPQTISALRSVTH